MIFLGLTSNLKIWFMWWLALHYAWAMSADLFNSENEGIVCFYPLDGHKPRSMKNTAHGTYDDFWSHVMWGVEQFECYPM